MVAIPAATPVTIPVVPTKAIDVTLLVHVPPGELLLSIVVDPWHKLIIPVIAPGSGLTTTVVVYTVTELQPDPELLTVNE